MPKIILEKVDLFGVLEQLDVPYSAGVKNVAPGWIGVACPFCGDETNHLGINIEARTISCWKCGTKGTLLKFLKEFTGSWARVLDVVRLNYSDALYFASESRESDDTAKNVLDTTMPSGMRLELNSAACKYLESRRYDPYFLEEKYDLRCTNGISYIRWDKNEVPFDRRIIVPIKDKNKILTYVGIDYTRKSSMKYKNCPKECSIEPVKNCWYNLDSVRGTAIVVEGITDAWRMGDGAIASLGKIVTENQIVKLLQSGVNKVFVLFDSDADRDAEKLAYTIGSFIPTKLVLLDEGDPDDLSDKEAEEIRKELIFSVD